MSDEAGVWQVDGYLTVYEWEVTAVIDELKPGQYPDRHEALQEAFDRKLKSIGFEVMYTDMVGP